MSEITWGDTVQILEIAPSHFRPGEAGSVCGFNEVDRIVSYTVEFGDGETLEIPSPFISKIEISN